MNSRSNMMTYVNRHKAMEALHRHCANGGKPFADRSAAAQYLASQIGSPVTRANVDRILEDMESVYDDFTRTDAIHTTAGGPLWNKVREIDLALAAIDRRLSAIEDELK